MENPEDIDARPSKALFIEMLTKDIPLIRAILDLVDNSVDGARDLRPSGNYKGLEVKLDVAKNRFRISDNCGGIPVHIARDYAFRFGRADDAPQTPGSVGQFGVGMKRAFFKIGKHFVVESKTKNSSFIVQVDVNKWEKEKDWVFKFKEFAENERNSADSIGTTAIITQLNEYVADLFGQENFRIKLAQELETAHLLSMDHGLQITLNGVPLQNKDLVFRTSKLIKPVEKEIEFKDKQHPVYVRIVAGIGDSIPKDAGWYIFCNGRMLLEREKTQITGWGERATSKIPVFHQQFARFRGYVFYNSDNAELLPWNTTKTGVDIDSPIYLSIRLEMINLMRPIIDFLNELKESKEKDDEEQSPLAKAVNATKVQKIDVIQSYAKTFEVPKFKKKEKTADSVPIKYDVPREKAEVVKRSLGAKNWREVGEKTFDYYFRLEGDENA